MLFFLRPVWKTAAIAGLVVVARAASEVLAVYFLSPAVTAIATKLAQGNDQQTFWTWFAGDSVSARELRSILLWMATTQITLGLMIYLRSVWDTKLSMRAVFHMRAAVYDRLQRADLSFHDRMSSGPLINRAINDLQAVRMFVNMSLLASLDIIFSLAFYLGLLGLRSPWLLGAALIPVPLWSLAIFRFSKKAQGICSLQQKASDRLMAALSENLYGVHVVRSFASEDREVARYSRLNRRLLANVKLAVGIQALLSPTLRLITMLAHVGLFLLTAWLIHEGRMTIGDLMLLGAAMAAILGKLQQINAVVEIYQKAVVSSRRLFEIMDLPDATRPERKIERAKLTHGEIEFRDVCFSYAGSRVLDDVTARIPGGRITALMGPTGAGKTTLAGLIARFYDPERGQITIDGQDLRHFDVRDLRRRVGYVFQETFLFSSTIRDNIRYGRKDVSDEMVKVAARISMADEFIEKLPQGYDTMIGERGVALSGGQKQRLALARALVYDPEILILDEATTALDASTEEAVHERLDGVFKNRTVLLIGSRLVSVLGADRILVLEKGRLTQDGTHDELLHASGHYREIISAQAAWEETPRELAVGSLP